MSIVTRLLFTEKRAHPSQEPDEWLVKLLGGRTAAGVDVTVDGSLASTAVYACIRILAETVASLPLILYRRLPRGRERATNHRLYPLLHDLPNPEMTSMELRETLMGHLAGWGNCFAEIEYDGAGRVRALWPLPVDKMQVRRVGGQLLYVVNVSSGAAQVLPAERVWHIKGMGNDGVVGYSPIRKAMEAIGLALATQEYGARFFGNGARAGVVLEHPGLLSDDAYDRLKNSWEMRHQGLEQSHRVAILEEGMKIEQIGVPPDEAQFLETRKFQVTEIARLFRIPPHMLADLDRATFSNIEQQSIEFVTYTLSPWLVRWEQSIYRALLTERERTEFYAEHLVNALLRGDTPSRFQAYAQGRQNGWLSANEIREMENMNPVDGGDVYLVPLNMVPADSVGEPPPQPAPAAGDEDQRSLDHRPPAAGAEQRAARVANLVKARQGLKRSYRRLIDEAAGRVVRREVADVRRAVSKYLGKRDAFQLATWLKQFYAEHREFWVRQMLPVLLSYADAVGSSVADELGGDPKTAEDIRAFLDAYAAALSRREAGSSQMQLQDLLDNALQAGEDPEPILNQRLDEWDEKRAGKVTTRETVAMMGACTVAFYKLAGVVRHRWVTVGDSCAYCQGLDGTVVGIEKFFIEAGADFQPAGADRPLNSSYSVGHAPAHDGCDCLTMADVG